MSTGRSDQRGQSTIRPHRETAGRRRAERGRLRTYLHTADGVTIDAAYDPGPRGAARAHDTGPASSGRPADLAIVVAHGFTGDLERPHVRRVAGVLARYGAVVTFSFRGHGASGGTSTVGDREVDDLAAAVAWARELGHSRVVTVGFSMGGSVVLRHAARHHPDAVVAVSSPARWFYRGTAPMRRLHWLILRPTGRLVGRYGMRTRIDHRPWDPVPASPTESVPLIAPTPLLIVHGDQDAYFPLDHPRMLAHAAPDAELWLEPGMGHAEHASDDALLARIGAWAVSHAGALA